MTIISHWLLILNSSCNIAIYLHKDPKFKAVLKDMFVSKLSPRLRNAFKLSDTNLEDDQERPRKVSRVSIKCLKSPNQLLKANCSKNHFKH